MLQRGSGSAELLQVFNALTLCVTHVVSKSTFPTPGSAHCTAPAYDRPPGSLRNVFSLLFVTLGGHRRVKSAVLGLLCVLPVTSLR